MTPKPRSKQTKLGLAGGFRAFSAPHIGSVLIGFLVLAGPALANYVLWKNMVVPHGERRARLERLERMQELEPAYQQLLKKSHQVLTANRRAGGMDSSADAISTLQRTAGQNRIRITDLSAEAARRAASPVDPRLKAKTRISQPIGSEGPAVALRVAGRFHRLGRWLEALEEEPGLQVESWTLEAAETQDGEHEASLTVAVLGAGQ